MIGLRPMTHADLPQVEVWLQEPHVARWWTPDTTAGAEVEKYRRRLGGEDDRATVMLIIIEDGEAIGWCQWYRWDRYPDDAEAMGALPGEVGIDYAIGDPGAVGRGLGTEMIAVLVAEVRLHHPGAGVLVDPDAANQASRQVLERNGFELVAVRTVASEPSDHPMAIYRRPAAPGAGDRPLSWAPPSPQRPAPGPVLLVDAANVVGSRPTGWWRDRAGAGRRLVEHIRAATASGRLEPPIIVVLEGAARSGMAEGSARGVQVVHASGSGDDRLVEMAAAAAPRTVVLVSADRELRRRVTATGGTAVGPDWLHGRLDANERT
jgi:RimJ/RimL family protein N-acetyltransferase